MNCPTCVSNSTLIINTSPRRKGAIVKRRRECPLCEACFDTVELTQQSFHRLRELLRARRDLDAVIEDITSATWFVQASATPVY
jgi:transcriptional regulator NrdR family protein